MIHRATRTRCSSCSSDEPGNWRKDPQPRLDGREYVVRVCDCGQVRDRLPFESDLGGGIRIRELVPGEAEKAAEEQEKENHETIERWRAVKKERRRQQREKREAKKEQLNASSD